MTPYQNIQPNSASVSYTFQPVEEKFRALRFIARIFRVLAVLTAIVLGLVGVVTESYYIARLTTNSESIFALLLWGIVLIALMGLPVLLLESISQSIKLFISIEHNQRVQAEYLRRLAESQLLR